MAERSARVVIFILFAAFASACNGSSSPPADTGGINAATPTTPVEAELAEDGVPVLTSDADAIGEPTVVYAHFDEPSGAVWRLLARSEPRAEPVVNVEIQPTSTFDSASANAELFDGRPANVEEFDSGMTRVTFAGAQGQWVQFSSFELEDLSLIGLASPVGVNGDTIESLSDDWLITGSIELPLYEDGYQTVFNDSELPGIQVEILSSRLTGDLDLWYEWVNAERVDDPRFDWAFRQRNEVFGVDRFVALWDDGVVVEINNVVNDDILAEVIDGLREMQPEEAELVLSSTGATVAS